MIRSILLDNLIFYLPESMLKPTEIWKKVKNLRKKNKKQRKYINHCIA